MRLLQIFFFYSNRTRSIYQFSYMLRGFRDKIVTFKVYFVSKFPKETGYKEDSTKYGCLS